MACGIKRRAMDMNFGAREDKTGKDPFTPFPEYDKNPQSTCQRRRLSHLSPLPPLPRGALRFGPEIGRGRFGVVRAADLLSFSSPNLSFSDPNSSFSDPNLSFPKPSSSFSDPNLSFSEPNLSFSQPNLSFSEPNFSFSDPNLSFSSPNLSFPSPNLSFSSPNLSFSSSPVAVKTLPLSQWEAATSEISALASVSGHPHIVGLRGWTCDSEGVHVAMERVCGGELFAFINAGGRLAEKRAAAIMRQLADGTAFCHRRGVMHRDLKPENVLLGGGGRGGEGGGGRRGVAHGDECECDTCYPEVKITDFGLAVRMKSAATEGVEGEGGSGGEGEGEGEAYGMAGSPLYMAPEVALSQRYGPKADVWSLGVMLYVLLCGSAPFYGKTELETLRAAQSGHVDFSHSLWRQVAPEAVALLRRMLSRDATRRPTAAQVLAHPWMVQHTPLTKRAALTTALTSADFEFWERVEREEAEEEAAKWAEKLAEEESKKLAEELVAELVYEVLPGGALIGGLSCSGLSCSGLVAGYPPWALENLDMGEWDAKDSSGVAPFCPFVEDVVATSFPLPTSDNLSFLPSSPAPVLSFVTCGGDLGGADFDLEGEMDILAGISVPKMGILCDNLSQKLTEEREKEEKESNFMTSPKTPFDFSEVRKETNLGFQWDDILLGNSSVYF